ncbi:MAG TPA: division plane positioning ATPase MipZ [Parvibaculum sp.]|mgnify:FL=1|uniref:division plane positioning ATPase MipZ n=1 Tax=Parvibaculum sp. TaxID=2024848 RepID=UPI002CFA3A25|nr:division plane positioning ATPase MipZ [Parvibaculum sp.]HMM15025.1 division plane positioning ATPase MipZ [Parvibaculum sp.]
MTDTGQERKSAHIVVLGNEKGGSGKTTSAMHLIALLLHEGARVGSMDLDGRQRSLTRYVENRKAWAEANRVNLVMPDHVVIARSDADSVSEAQAAEREAFETNFARLALANDFVVIDCPGSDTFLSRLGHAVADTLITPMNDSFVDFDLLGRVDPQSWKIKGPSVYSEMVWESRKRRVMADGGKIDWVVMRNRLSSLAAKNKRRVEGVLESLADRIGFRLAPGFGERVIFREMFPSGLTLLDLREEGVEAQMSMSHVAARAEVRALLDVLQLPMPAARAESAAPMDGQLAMG